MQQSKRRPRRAIARVDVAASLAFRVAPRALRPAIEQLRLDARSVFDGLSGVREPSWSSPSRPPLAPVPLHEIDPVHELLPRALRRPYSVMRRDVETIARELRGHRAPATIARPRPSARAVEAPSPADRGGPIARRARVARLVRETPDAVTIELALEDGAPLAFEPGQFLTLHLPIDGEIVRRAYSLSCARGEGRVAVTCKRVEGGRASSFVSERLREGDALEVHGPSGTFVAGRAQRPRHLVLVAGGSGITPCWSIARSVLADEPGARVTLVYGNRSERDVIFRDAIDALARREGARLRVVHVLSAPEGDHEGSRGVLDEETFGAIARELGLESRGPGEIGPPSYFVCGPAAMMDAVRGALRALGVAPERIREERFQTPGERHAALPSAPQLVTVRRRAGGAERSFEVAPGATVLDAARARGVALPFSCAIGGCAACKCRVIEGEIAMDEPSCLTAEERAAGWVLTCVGHPTRETTLEVP